MRYNARQIHLQGTLMINKKLSKRLLGLSIPLLLSGCSYYQPHDGVPHYYRDVSTIPNAVPRYLPKSPYGNKSTYHVDGRTYHVLPTANGYNENGIASWYGSLFDGRNTSTHERYDPYGMTAASTVLPIPCFVRVTNLENGRWIIVKVNDRGPFVANRIMDLSYAGAVKLGYIGHGTALVNVRAIDTYPGYSYNPYATSYQPVRTYYRPVRITHQPELYLQLGVFRSRYNAERLQQMAARVTDKPTMIRAIRSDDGNILYRVELGPLRDVSESDYIEGLFERERLGKPITIIR